MSKRLPQGGDPIEAEARRRLGLKPPPPVQESLLPAPAAAKPKPEPPGVGPALKLLAKELERAQAAVNPYPGTGVDAVLSVQFAADQRRLVADLQLQQRTLIRKYRRPTRADGD
jgi:hypothetical protein